MANRDRRIGKEAGQPASLSVKLAKNQLYTVSITDLNNLGMGVCRIGELVVFVRGAVTGDVAKIRILKVCRSYAVAKIEELLTPSEIRITPVCPIFGKCGGCVYGNITYEAEKRIKRDSVLAALRKAGLADVRVAPLLCVGETGGYRNKVQYPVAPNGKIGYYAPHSHTIIPCEKCDLQARAMDEPLARVRAWMQTYQVFPRHLYLRYAKQTGQILVCLVSQTPTLPHEAELVEMLKSCSDVVSVLVNVQPEETNVILGKTCRTLYGTDFMEDVLCGLTFRIAARSFYQVNHDAAELLYRKVYALSGIKAGDRIVDLFCGTGTIGLFCLSQCPDASLIGVEVTPEAVENARENARRNHLANAVFSCADANDPHLKGADVLILDPPRKGCEAQLITQIAALRPRRVIYVSCDPNTFARDLSLFRQAGFSIGEVTPVDLFPRTGHVENVVCLVESRESD